MVELGVETPDGKSAEANYRNSAIHQAFAKVVNQLMEDHQNDKPGTRSWTQEEVRATTVRWSFVLKVVAFVFCF